MSKNNKQCPTCGKIMKQQFVGLQHCSCGTSWLGSRGYFTRTNDMIFCLQRKKVGKKIKQIPVIRYQQKDLNNI